MKINEIINESLFSTIIITGTIIPEKMEMVTALLTNNADIIGRFRNVVLCLNCINDSDWKYAEEYENNIISLVSYYDTGAVHILRDYINRGWQFGTMDIEKMAYSFCNKNLSQDIILKIDFDIYLQKQLLDLETGDADVLFMPSVGYAPVEHNSSTILKEFENEKWDILQPQSTIYIIKKKLDYLYVGQDWLNKKYKEWILNPIGNGPHHIGVACEPLLRKSFERNSCKMKSMISLKSFKKLIETIQAYKMHDPSHKNILFEEVGVCHLYDENQDIIKI